MKPHTRSKLSVAVLFGGPSAEHEISVLTALQAISAMDSITYDIVPVYMHVSGKFYVGDKLFDKKFYRNFSADLVREVTLLPDPQSKGFLDVKTNKLLPVDVYFLCFHGQYGEDGCLQGLLELKQQPYTGCSVITSALVMNKYMCKNLLEHHKVPVLPHVLVNKQDAMRDFSLVQSQICQNFDSFPLFVKPCHLGSSIGISVCRDRSDLASALAKVFYYDDQALIEPCITHLMEINAAVLGGPQPQVSILEMPKATSEVLSYEDKYLRGGSKESSGSGMASLSRIIDPDIPKELKEEISSYALKAFTALGCSGVVRIDFMIDLDSGRVYFNELNPIPGSLSFYLWEKSNPPLLYTEMLNHLIEQAFDRCRMKLSLQQNLDFKVLT